MTAGQIAEFVARLNQKQRCVVWIAAIAILVIQILKFMSDGIYGYGWVFSIFVAGLLFVILLARPSLPSDSAKLLSANDLFKFSSEVCQKVYGAIERRIGAIPFASEKLDINQSFKKMWQIESILFSYVFVAVCGAVYDRAYLSSGRFVNFKSQVRRALRHGYKELAEEAIPVSGNMPDDRMADGQASAALEKADLMISAICQNPSSDEKNLWDPLFKNCVSNIGLSNLDTPESRNEFFGPIIKPLMKQYKGIASSSV